jgi:hypothetical protein
MTGQPIEDTIQALRTIYTHLNTLASINAASMLIPSGPQERYHEIVEEAYAALGKVETVIDELGAELEYQHKRLDEARDAALAGTMHTEQEQQTQRGLGVDAEGAEERAHEDWANDE